MIDWKNEILVNTEGKKFQLEELFSEEEIHNRIQEVAKQISKDYAGKEVVLICILKGAILFLTDLMRELDIKKMSVDFMEVRSYEACETNTSGNVKIIKDIDKSIENKHIIIVEDIIDSGYTLKQLKEMLLTRNPASFKICVLLDKQARRQVELKPDYVCFPIEDRFIVGYGLDFDQEYRNVPYVGVVNFID